MKGRLKTLNSGTKFEVTADVIVEISTLPSCNPLINSLSFPSWLAGKISTLSPTSRASSSSLKRSAMS